MAVPNVRMVGEQQRPGAQALQHQCAEKNGRYRVTGNPHGQQRNERTAGDAVIGRFRCRDAVQDAGAELVAVLARSFGLAVGDEGGDIAAGRRNDPDDGADN